MSGSIFSLQHVERKRTILFPVQTEYAGIRVDPQLRELWSQVQLPKTDADIEARLHAAGHLSESQLRVGHLEKSRRMHTAIRIAAGQKLISDDERRAKRIKYPKRMTNVHLLGQFDWLTTAGGKAAPADGAAAASASSSGAASASGPK